MPNTDMWSKQVRKTICLLIVITSLGVVGVAFGQGIVVFNTRVTSNGVNALVTYSPGGPVPGGTKPSSLEALLTSGGCVWGTNARACLYGGTNGSTEQQLVRLGSALGFRGGAAAGYVNPGSDSLRMVPNVPPGGMATLQVRAWDAGVPGVNSYEVASGLGWPCYLGKSPLLNGITLGDSNSPAYLIGLESFTMDGPATWPSGSPGCLLSLSAAVSSTNTLILRWPSVATLQIQTNSSGISTNWYDIPPDPHSPGLFTVPLQGNRRTVFYRLKLQ